MRGGAVAQSMEICDCDDVEVYVEVVILMYSDDLKRSLMGVVRCEQSSDQGVVVVWMCGLGGLLWSGSWRRSRSKSVPGRDCWRFAVYWPGVGPCPRRPCPGGVGEHYSTQQAIPFVTREVFMEICGILAWRRAVPASAVPGRCRRTLDTTSYPICQPGGNHGDLRYTGPVSGRARVGRAGEVLENITRHDELSHLSPGRCSWRFVVYWPGVVIAELK
ncbi:hypothetical protein Drorol1_Dr00008874 [Drosera rotundifolia]